MTENLVSLPSWVVFSSIHNEIEPINRQYCPMVVFQIFYENYPLKKILAIQNFYNVVIDPCFITNYNNAFKKTHLDCAGTCSSIA